MRIALYIQDGLEQIVLTPDTETEKSILGKLHDGSREFQMRRGSFFECQGGHVRGGFSWEGAYGGRQNDDSTIIVMRPTAPPEQSK